MLTEYIKTNRIILSILLLLLFTFAAVKLAPGFLMDYYRASWIPELENKINSIVKGSVKEFEKKESSLVKFGSETTEAIREAAISSDNDDIDINEVIYSAVNSIDAEGYTIEVYDDVDNLIAWTYEQAIYPDGLEQIKENIGTTFFVQENLVVRLIYTKRVSVGDDIFYVVTGIPFEKKYSLAGKYYSKVSYTTCLEEKYLTDFEVVYDPDETIENDGTLYTFPVINYGGHTVAKAAFVKPLLEAKLDNTIRSYHTFEGLLAFAFVLMLGFMLLNKLMKTEFNLLRFFYVTVYVVLLRLVLYNYEIPARFLGSELSQASYFSSTFLLGLVRSPLEFFITLLAFLAITYSAFRYSIKDYFASRDKHDHNIWSVLTAVLMIVLYLLALRGFGASVRSVLFDSTLLYFKDTSLLPEIPKAFMHLNVFLLGSASFIGSAAFVLILATRLPLGKTKSYLVPLITAFVLLQLFGYLFDVFQNEPQGNHLTRILHICFTFAIVYYIAEGRRKFVLIFLFVTFSSSVVSALLMNIYNTKLERESLLIVAKEIVRKNQNWLDFIVREVLIDAGNTDVKNNSGINESTDYIDAAFKLWSNSSLRDETVPSSIGFYDNDGVLLGGVSFNVDDKYLGEWNNGGVNSLRTEVVYHPDYDTYAVRGVIPYTYNDGTVGYVLVEALSSSINILFNNLPEFLGQNMSVMRTPLDVDKVFILEYKNKDLIKGYNSLVLNNDQKYEILNSVNEQQRDAWLELDIKKEFYTFYVVMREKDYHEVLAIGLKSRDISWSLYDFFKVFFVYTIYILLGLAVISLFIFSHKRIIKFNLRTQLLTAFLVISIIPLVLMAVYIRALTEEKNDSAIYYKLSKRAINVEEFYNNYLLPDESNFNDVTYRVFDDLGIHFTMYEGTDVLYSTNGIFYEVGLLPGRINPKAYNELELRGVKEFVVKESVENYTYNAFYYKANINGTEYIIKVADVFNSILLPLTGTEIDIFLFGSYSLAVILIIIISTILANRISYPIRKLTVATKSVASGDLSLEISRGYTGEVKELVESFNTMVKQLKKSQTQLAEMERESAWREMAKQVAHEIKNPLTPMKLAVQQLIATYKDKSPKFDDTFEKVTATVISQIETLKNIASEFSSFARMPSLKVEDVSLNKALNDVVNLFIDEKAVVNLTETTNGAVVHADEDQIKRIVINLIRNAIQANANKIEVKLADNDKHYEIDVIDNGSGIPDDIRNKIFEANFTTKLEGMGLGLSMARRYLESFRGSIEVLNTSPQGTDIRITFPKA